MPDPLDAVRAEGRRLLAEARQGTWLKPRGRFIDWMWDHADVLLADPAPEGLSEDERRQRIDDRAAIRFALEGECGHFERTPGHCAYCDGLLALDRLTGASDV